jgi:hypothetical protein
MHKVSNVRDVYVQLKDKQQLMQADVCSTTNVSTDTAAESCRVQQHAMHRGVNREATHVALLTFLGLVFVVRYIS